MNRKAAISQQMIAEKAGVSYATVSRAFTHSAKVRPETIAVIRKAMKELGAANIEQVVTERGIVAKTVLLITGEIMAPFYPTVIASISQALEQNGMHLMLYVSAFNDEKELNQLNIAASAGFAGAIMLTICETKALTEFLQETRLPIVLLNRYIRAVDLDVVRVDNYRGGYYAAQYLIDQGHRKLAVFSGPLASSSMRDRARGFENACNDMGVDFNVETDLFECEYTPESVRPYVQKALKSSITAVFIAADILASIFNSELVKCGKNMPDDINVICFDDSYLTNENGLSISTLSFKAETMGATAVELLLNRIANPLEEKKKILYSPTFVDRGSVKNINKC